MTHPVVIEPGEARKGAGSASVRSAPKILIYQLAVNQETVRNRRIVREITGEGRLIVHTERVRAAGRRVRLVHSASVKRAAGWQVSCVCPSRWVQYDVRMAVASQLRNPRLDG